MHRLHIPTHLTSQGTRSVAPIFGGCRPSRLAAGPPFPLPPFIPTPLFGGLPPASEPSHLYEMKPRLALYFLAS